MLLIEYNDSFTDMCRYFDDGESTLCGKIRWHLWEKKLELRPNLGRREGTRTILWNDKGHGRNDESDEKECTLQLAAFVREFGGPYFENQWDAIAPIHFKLWATATKLWGHPQLVPVDEELIDDESDGSSDGSDDDSDDESDEDSDGNDDSHHSIQYTWEWKWDEGRREYYYYDNEQSAWIYQSGTRIRNPQT
jgi:hypothetical protein